MCLETWHDLIRGKNVTNCLSWERVYDRQSNNNMNFVNRQMDGFVCKYSWVKIYRFKQKTSKYKLLHLLVVTFDLDPYTTRSIKIWRSWTYFNHIFWNKTTNNQALISLFNKFSLSLFAKSLSKESQTHEPDKSRPTTVMQWNKFTHFIIYAYYFYFYLAL